MFHLYKSFSCIMYGVFKHPYHSPQRYNVWSPYRLLYNLGQDFDSCIHVYVSLHRDHMSYCTSSTVPKVSKTLRTEQQQR